MNTEIYKYLFNYSQDATEINRLITSSFILINKTVVQRNVLLKVLIIKEGDVDWKNLQEFVTIWRKNKLALGFEELIELFEFVVSPADKIINGAVYTPVYIREYILNECYKLLNKSFEKSLYADLACGCGAFLFSIARKIRKKKQLSYSSIYPLLYGLDITSYSIERTKILLSLLAVSEGEDKEFFKFSLYCGNALSFDFFSFNPVQDNNGFDIIVGNPPYVCSRNMDKISLELLKNWQVTKSGHPDLYIPFFQIGFENLTHNGVLGYITVNTFIKSINGRALRQYFADKSVDFKIINFGGEQVFKDKNTYTCLCFLKRRTGAIRYRRTESSLLEKLTDSDFLEFDYADLNHHDGWNLVNTNEKNEFIRKIEVVGKPFKELFNTRNGIATLKNEVYKFTPTKHDADFYYLIKEGQEYAIEKGICRRIVNANKIKTEADLRRREEKIIFPYRQIGSEIHILHETELRSTYPNALRYLKSQKENLANRDKNKTENYEKWYAYGRRQSMDNYTYKLFFPHICERPTFVISKDRELLFYNGIAVVSDSLEELIELKSLLESDIFFDYIKSTTKDYSSGYISMSKNYIKNFGIAILTEEEKAELNSPTINTNKFWNKIYKKHLRLNR